VGLLDQAPDLAEVRAELDRWVTLFQRFRQRVAIGSPLTGGSRWVDDEHFSLDFHLRCVRAPSPADLSALLALAEPTATAPFDPARAPWELTLVDGLADGAAGFIMRFHHTITDGVGAVDMARHLFGTSEEGPSGPASGAAPVPQRNLVGQLTGAAQQVVRLAGSGLAAARAPVATARQTTRLARSIAKALAPVPAALSPVFTRRGLDRHLAVLEVPLGDLRRAAKAMECTVNDVFLAAVGGALHSYHRANGHEVPALRFTMPISVRTPDDEAGGNRFAPARFVLPIDDPDPAVRARIAHATARRWRDEPAMARSGDLAVLLDLLPGAVVTRLFADMLEKVDVDAVDVPGLAEIPSFGGARVERLWAFAPPTGAALSVTLLSHGDVGCIAVNADRDAVPDPAELHSCLETSMAEILGAAGIGPLGSPGP
jgi:WS/DGAT/MGAT family acyltransferase